MTHMPFLSDAEGGTSGRPDAPAGANGRHAPEASTWPITPPRAWRDPERHFREALEGEWYRMTTRVLGRLVDATAQFYREREIIPALMPITVGSVSSPQGLGSDSEPVSVELFGVDTYLADSMQFQLELLVRHGFTGVYYVMPTFRGEDHDSTHLNQFFHSEAEIVGGLDEVIQLVESYVRALVDALLEGPLGVQVEAVAGRLDHLSAVLELDAFPRVTYDEARSIIGDGGFRTNEHGIVVITREGERQLMREVGEPVWLTQPPALSVPFYQRVNCDGTAEAADLLLGCGEVVGCGARHETGAEVRRALDAPHVHPDEYRGYVQMKDEYPLATAGFGLGVERFLLWALQHDDVRDLHVMPRLKGIPSWA